MSMGASTHLKRIKVRNGMLHSTAADKVQEILSSRLFLISVRFQTMMFLYLYDLEMHTYTCKSGYLHV